jgi:hypothetical protein
VTDTHQFNTEAPENQGTASDFAEHTSSEGFSFTWLRDRFAHRKRLIRLSGPEKFARCLRATTAPTKAALPWAKLSELGPNLSPNGSYRYDANVVALHGAEGDYDGDELPIEDAASLIQAAGIEAVLNETTTPGHWRLWLPSSRAYRGSPDELRALRAWWVARANGVLDGILAPESFVLSQAFYVGGLKGQTPIKVIVTEGARIDLCDDLDDGAIFKNGASEPGERRQQAAASPGDITPSDDDPRLVRECQQRVAGFAKRWGYGITPTGEHAHRVIQWCADAGTRDRLTPSAQMIRDAIRLDYPKTTRSMIEGILARRRDPRGWDVIDPEPELPWDEDETVEDGETIDA